jgi:carbamoyltransferase
MNILGLFAPGPNPSAALLVDGKLVAWAEEERFNRIKTSPNDFPFKASRFCLEQAGLHLDQIDAIAYGWDCTRYALEVPIFYEEQYTKYHDTQAYNKLQQAYRLNLYHPDRIAQTLRLGLRQLSPTNRVPPIHYFSHHLSHAASAFYCSGFDEAVIVSIDGSGEEISTLLAKGERDSTITELKHYKLPHSLGGVYATFTEFLGFTPYMDEGKVTGLASYGSYNQELQDKLDKVLSFDPQTGHYAVNPYMRFIGAHSYGRRFTDEFVELFGTPRSRTQSALDAPYPDIAFAVQWRLEQTVMAMVRHLIAETGIANVCLAGGVAMNCAMNGKIAQLPAVKRLFVQPAATDNGVSLGAAMLLARANGEDVRWTMRHLYWGPSYSNEHIESVLKKAKVSYRKSAHLAREVAQLLADGKIVGWMQGAMELGARALGNRSILASPLYKDMKDKLNLDVKNREAWRPFCPSIKAESYERYIPFGSATTDAAFMIVALPVAEQERATIPSCVHVDGTARVQRVTKDVNPTFWEVLDEFERLTGHGILINTSFNVQGEPTICTPQDALRCFFSTGMDALALGDFLLEKKGAPAQP